MLIIKYVLASFQREMRTLVVASATSAAVLATACNGLTLYTSLLYLLSFTIWLLTGGHYFLYLAYHTLGRDIGYVQVRFG